MTDKLTEMWKALEAYQPIADADGHGESWALMCSERTSDAAYDATYAAAEAAAPFATYVANAGYAANAAYYAAYTAAYTALSATKYTTWDATEYNANAGYIAAKYAQRSIDYITKAQEKTE